MADIFISYAGADREIVGCIVALLEAQGWSVWWDTRIDAGERSDEIIEREIATARCVVVVWTQQSIDREWVHEEADHGRERSILVSILIGLDKPPFGFRRIQASNLSGWDGNTRTATADQFLADVGHKLGNAPRPSLQPSSPQTAANPAVDRGRTDALTAELRTLRTASITSEADFESCLREPGTGRFRWFKDIDIGPEMVVVPAGEFIMGSNERESEQPLHKVIIKEPFAVGRFAVTFAEWDAAGLPHKPRDEGWGRGKQPVINVSWEDAKAFTEWLARKTGKDYRLLSEAEWEYVARAGTSTAFWLGTRFRPRRLTSMAEIVQGSENFAIAPCPLTASTLTGGVCTRFMATYGSGAKTVGTKTTKVRRKMDRHARAGMLPCESCEVALGTVFQPFSVRASATGIEPVRAVTRSGSA